VSAEFVSLADLLRAVAPSQTAQPDALGVAPDAGADHRTSAATVDGARDEDDPRDTHDTRGACSASDDDRVISLDADDVTGGALRDARLFRARLADALDDAVVRLVRELAADVLMRELRLAPCEIAALVRRVLRRAPVIRVRVAPADVALVTGVPVLADPALAPGDAIVELASGALDARLGVRLSAVLEAFA